MAFIRLPLGVRVALEYEAFGKVVVNVYHVTTTDPIVTIKLFDIADLFEAWWATTIGANFSNEIALSSITAHNLNVPNGEKITLPVSPSIPGGSANASVPNNVAIVITLNTALTGRSFRGRAYHAGLTRAAVTGNNIDTILAASLVTDYIQLTANLAVANAELVVASFQTLGVPRAEGVATPVQSIAVNTRIDTQRRRLPAE